MEVVFAIHPDRHILNIMKAFPLPNLPPDQLAIHLQCFHPTGRWTPFQDEDIQQSIPSRFAAIVNRFPNNIAVKSPNNIMTYTELNSAANQVANFITIKIGTEAAPIIICCQHDVSAIIAMLGVLKAGKFYTYIDPTADLNQNNKVITNINPAVILVDSETKSVTSELIPDNISIVNIESTELSNMDATDPGLDIRPSAFAYITFTSGSTDQSKGVIEDHQDVLSFTARFTNYFHQSPEDRQLLASRMNFGAAGVKIYPALLVGASLLLYDLHKYGIPGLANWIAQQGITVYGSTVTLFRELLKYLPAKRELTALRRFTIGGEPIRRRDIQAYREILPDHTIMIISFGSTEAHFSTCYYFNKESNFDMDEIPLGFPAGDNEILLLDNEGNEVPQGEIGEIVIRRPLLTRGYWRNPELTASRYKTDPAKPDQRMFMMGDLGYMRSDGCIIYKGRKDSQVKLKGQFVDLQDLEHILEQNNDVELAFALVKDYSTASPELVTYVKLIQDSEATVRSLYRYLINRLPRYMIPNAVVIIDNLPRTLSGKLDVSALPDPGISRPELQTPYAPPVTPLHKRLIELWQEVLHIEVIGINDDFIELGADSLRGMMFLNRLQELLGEYVYIQTLFEAPTIAAFSSYLEENYTNTIHKLFEDRNNNVRTQHTQRVQQKSMGHKLDASIVEEIRGWFSHFSGSQFTSTDGVSLSDQKNPTAHFIFSTLRSGSTLCRVMLGGHPQLFAPPELSLLYFKTLRERREMFSQQDTGERHGTIRAIMAARHCDVETAEKMMDRFERSNTSVKTFYHQLQNWIHPRILVDKTPGYTYILHTLNNAESLFNSPSYLYLVRHPCGMINSSVSGRFVQRILINLKRRNPDLVLPDLSIDPRYTPEIISEAIWIITQENIQSFLRAIPSKRKYMFRFEDLVRRPEQLMRQLSHFLNIDFHEGMLHPYADKSKRMTDGIHALSRLIGDVKLI